MEPAVATGPLGALSHDELGVIFDGLADPLQPVVAVALSSTCLGLRTPLLAALEVLQQRHKRAVALCHKVGTSCAELRDMVAPIYFGGQGLTAADMATLGMILRTNGLPWLEDLDLTDNRFGDAGMQALCEGFVRGAAPRLQFIDLHNTAIGLAGAEALATALRRGAPPKLEALNLNSNPALGNQGVAALATALRKLPTLGTLGLCHCKIDGDGVASLFADLGKDDFKKLKIIYFCGNEIMDTGCSILADVLKAGGLPRLTVLNLEENPVADEVVDAVNAVRPTLRVLGGT